MSILPNMGSENWPVWIWKLVATVAMGLGQFQRFLPCDLGTGLHTHIPLASPLGFLTTGPPGKSLIQVLKGLL